MKCEIIICVKTQIRTHVDAYALKLYAGYSCAVCTVLFSKNILFSLQFWVLQCIVGEGSKGDF